MIVELISITPDPEKHIERCSRICYDSDDRITSDSHEKFLPPLLKNGHLSVFEHASATFFIDEVSRACTHQLVRQRMASYSQRSQRYVKESDFGYVIPPEIEKDEEAALIYVQMMLEIQDTYNKLIALGIRKEDARFIMPNAAHTTLSMTANFREWLHVIDLRVSLHAQWEIREMMLLIWRELYQRAPVVFGMNYFNCWSKDADYKRDLFENRILQSK